MKDRYRLPEIPEQEAWDVLLEVGQWFASSFGLGKPEKSEAGGFTTIKWVSEEKGYIKVTRSEGILMDGRNELCITVSKWSEGRNVVSGEMCFEAFAPDYLAWPSRITAYGDQGYRWVQVIRGEYEKRARTAAGGKHRGQLEGKDGQGCSY